MHKFYRLVVSIYLLLTCFSCSTNKPEFGKTVFRQISGDSINIQKRIDKIKMLDNALFTSNSFIGREKIAIPYRLFKPEIAKKKSTKLPLVIVFHGSNAIGSDNIAQLGILAKLFASPKTQARYPAYVLAPQFQRRSSNYSLNYARQEYTSIAQPLLRDVLHLIDSLKQNLEIDNQRIYLVGYSMGGSTLINALSARPDLFAAGISISGVPQFENIRLLAKIPIWLIHGTADTENPFSSTVQFNKELSFNNKVRFWEFEGKAHNDIFSKELLGNELPKWIFSQKKDPSR
jgi:predicted peptidase